MKKKLTFTCILLCLCMAAAVVFTGCGSTETAKSSDVIKVAIVQQLDHSSLDEIRLAIQAQLDAIAAEKNLPMEGKTLRVLCDGISKGNPEVYSGRTEGGKIVFFHGTPDMTGKFVNIHIERTEAFALWGEIAE